MRSDIAFTFASKTVHLRTVWGYFGFVPKSDNNNQLKDPIKAIPDLYSVARASVKPQISTTEYFAATMDICLAVSWSHI